MGQGPTTRAPTISMAPRTVINNIHMGPIDEEYNSKRKKQRLLRVAFVRERVSSIRPGLADRGMGPIDEIITFPLVDPNRVLQSHQDALILTLRINDFDVRRILVYPGILADLLQMVVFK